MHKTAGFKKYQSFSELSACEALDVDYRIRFRRGNSGIVIMAPHGGDIEPGTTEIARAVAGKEHSFYSFEGLKQTGNERLHITSTRFDEPIGLELARSSEKVLAVHGCKGVTPMVYLGGRDTVLKYALGELLKEAGFQVAETRRFPGKNAHNLCNRGRSGAGVQLEISLALRMVLFSGLRRPERSREATQKFQILVSSIRKAFPAASCRHEHSTDFVIP